MNKKTAAMGNESRRINRAYRDDAAIARIKRKEREALESVITDIETNGHGPLRQATLDKISDALDTGAP